MAEVESSEKQESQAEDLFDSPEEEDEEIEFDSLDLKPDVLANMIKTEREIALGSDISDESMAKAVSLPQVMSRHSKRLGLTEQQFARAAANQGLDLGVLVDGLGYQGLETEDVFKTLKDKGTVAFKPLEERKSGMKAIRKKRIVETRGRQINELGQKRILEYEKEFDYTKDDLRKAHQTDYEKSRDPSTRQSSVAQIVYEMGSEAGFSNNQMAAILANGFAESQLNPSIKSKRKGEDSHGVWQFNRGAGEGVGHTVEQLQDPRFQMKRIIDAVNTRDELEGFRNPEADVNELTNQFMTHFEKPSIQDATEQKRRQSYLKRSNKLLEEAKKSKKSKQDGTGIVELDRKKRQEVLDRLRGVQKKDFKLLSDEEAAGGDVRNEVAKPGSVAYERMEAEVVGLLDPEKAIDPERATIISSVLAELSKDSADGIRETFSESGFQKLYDTGRNYDREVIAKRLGISLDEFDSRSIIDGSREQKIAKEIAERNFRHVALYLTTNKLGVPAFVSYEFMDPNNRMGEERLGKGDNYFRRFAEAASRNRVELVGIDDKDTPVYRAQSNLDSVFDKLNIHLSASSGALERLIDGPEGESIVEALTEGSISGVKKAQDFTKTLLSTQAARDSGYAALGLGIAGLAVDVLAPDPTFGFAKVASKTRAGIKKIQPLINKRYVPQALDDMGTAATEMINTQVLVTKAKEQFAAGDVDAGLRFLDQAKASVVRAEEVERGLRKKLENVMREVDRTDANVAQEIARDIPILTGRNTKNLDDSLGFSDFGLRRDYVHPSVERVVSRGDAEAQLVEYSEFFDISRKIDNLKELATKVKAGDTAGGWASKVQEDAIGPLLQSVEKRMQQLGFSKVKTKTQSDDVTRSLGNMLEFLSSHQAARLLVEDPKLFDARLRTLVEALPLKTPKGTKVVDNIFLNVEKAHKTAKKIAAKSAVKKATTDFKQELVDVTTSLAGIAESRGAAHAFTRNALAKQEKIKIEPAIAAVTNRYEEIGMDKISPIARAFRNELEDAFPAMRGDAAMHVARNLDDRLKAIHRQTGEEVGLIYETRAFKDIIPALKRKAIVGADEVAEGVAEAIVDPKFTKLEFGEELLTSKEVRDFASDISARLDAQEMTDFTANLATKTVKELKADAKARGIKGFSKLRKSDLIDVITKSEKKKTFLPDEYLRKNPEVAAQHEAAKKKVVDAQKDFEKALDELDALETANSPTVRDLLNQPSAVIRSIMEGSPDAEIINVGGVQVRAFKRDLAEGRVRMMADIRDQRIAELENLRRISEGKAEETLSLAEELDFIPGMIVKVEDGVLNVKTIELPEGLQGKGIATALYKVALARAKKEGLGFASDVNPSPEAQRIYERLIDEGVPFTRLEDGVPMGTGKMPPPPSSVGDVPGPPPAAAIPASGEAKTIQFVISKEDVAKMSDDLLQTSKAKKAVDAEDLAGFVEDTQTVVRAMEEAPSVEEFIQAISKVARRELDSTQMEAVTKWLATKGIKVGHRGAIFVADSPEVVKQAEDAFAKAFSDYTKGRPPPTTETTSAFEKIKSRLLGSFASAKNAQAEGAKFSPSSEIEQVFDDMLFGAQPLRQGSPNIFKALKRTLLDDLPNKVGDEYLLRIAKESDRLGYPISVKELKKLVVEASEKQAKNPDADIRIELPGPVSLGGLLSVKPKASYTLLEIGRGAASYAARKDLVDNPATRKMALDSRVNAVKELTPTQMIDQYVSQSRPVARIARAMYLGGDVFHDMRHLPPKIRNSIQAGVRMTQQSIGDTVTLISEGGGQKLIDYITGDPMIKFKSGRNAFSAGHDMMGSAAESLTDYIGLFANKSKTNTKHINVLLKALSKPIGKKLSNKPKEVKKIVEAFDALVFDPSGSVLLKDIFEAVDFKKGKTLEPKHMRMLESIFHITGNTKRKGVEFSGTSADQFTTLYQDLNRLFPVEKWGDAPVANRVTVLIAGHGQASKARLEWVDLGIAVDAKTAANFKKWIMGEAIDDIADLQKVRQAFQVHGYDPRFMEAADLEGLNFFVPKTARQKLSMALEQATDPELKEMSGDMLEAIGKGVRESQSGTQFAMAWTARYLKTRMVRGHFLLKGRYFWMNTMDHFNQMSQIVGFRPAFISTMRLLPQTFATNPVFQTALLGIQKVGPNEAGELMRNALTTAGDAGANWAASLTRASKWRGDLNAVLDARPGFLVVDGIPHAYADLRRIGVEEGMSASFDTAELGTKIRGAGEMFLENEKKRTGLMVIPGAPTAREMVKIAEDMAEGWGERERYGAMMTLVEMGVEPRKAARLVIDGLYDYAGSMSKADRHLLVNIFFPFWAFQKNANRQLIDVVFSPRGAYRLGVLNRAYTKGAQLYSELLYEDMVDPLGLNINNMDDATRDAYGALKRAILTEYGVPMSRLPPRLKREIRMAFTLQDVISEGGQRYEISKHGLELREKYGSLKGLFKDRFVEKPSRTSLGLFDTKRNAVMVPYMMNEQNKIFHEMLTKEKRNRTFSSFLIPEQSYRAAVNHVTLVTAGLFQSAQYLKRLGVDYLSAADAGEDFFQPLKPFVETVQPDRALLVSDLAAASGVNKNAPPYRIAAPLAVQLDQMGFEIFPVDKKEDPLSARLTYSQAMQDFHDGKINVMPEDPYLQGGELNPDIRYYISGGIGAMVLKNSIFDELNNIYKKWEKTPFEDAEGLRGDLQRWMRTIGVVDVRDVDPRKTAKGEKFEREAEALGTFEDVIKRRDAGYIDIDDYPDVKSKQEAERKVRKQKIDEGRAKENKERLERIQRSDSGDMEIDL